MSAMNEDVDFDVTLAPPKVDDIAAEPDYFALVLRDGLDLPIVGLEVTVTWSDGHACTAITSPQGAIAVPIPDEPTRQARVEVRDLTGERQQVCTLAGESCKNVVIVRSPKVKVELPLRPHQQMPPPRRPPPSATNAPRESPGPWWQANGALDRAWDRLKAELGISDHPPETAPKGPIVARTLSVAGQPVTIVAGPECPNKDGLRLGRNNIYRQPILDAARRLGLTPQALCALIDCEAAKFAEKIALLDNQGKPIVDKKGKARFKVVREVWDANSGNAENNAAGLTQFLRGTWLDHVMRPGFYIHEQSKAKAWVKLEPEPPGRLRRAVLALPGVKPKMRWVFVLANGKTTTTPGRELADANVQQCLAMRFDPAWSINAAADYGRANLQLLERAGFKIGTLTDMDKAKLMYLMHHEGEGAGPAFIRDTLGKLAGGTAGLRKKFEGQLGGNGAELRIKAADNDVEAAYRWWFSTYADQKFTQARSFFCSQPEAPTELSNLIAAVGGKHIRAIEER